MLTIDLQQAQDPAIAGGKGANLGRLLRAGFRTPGGFLITTEAFRAGMTGEVRTAILNAYRALGEAHAPVAVRSSATAEDMAGASMAGQYETFLDIRGDDALLAAVEKCWNSLRGDRAAAYLAGQGIDPAQVAMAVVVQTLVPADVAGVLFTVNPNGPGAEMMIEASWGLGESVVSGRVQPDVLVVEKSTGRLISQRIGDKREALTAGVAGEHHVSEDLRRAACLHEADVLALWDVGKHAEQVFGGPQDIEWALAGGTLYVLQSRPITTVGKSAADELLAEEKDRLRDAFAHARGPWVLHNLAETLPHPTPLTWSVIRRFMSAAGGYGEMYRDAGFQPADGLRDEGFLDLIGGRIYMDLSRAAEMFGEHFGYRYDLDAVKESGDVSAAAPTVPHGGLTSRLRAGRILKNADRRLRELAATYDRDLRQRIFPEFLAWTDKERAADLRSLTGGQLVILWNQRERIIMQEFAGKSLLPSLISGLALADLERFLAEHFWDLDPAETGRDISSGGINSTLLADQELYDVGKGQRPVEAWIAAHGHRAAGEFDVAAARWRECPAEINARARELAQSPESPLDRHHRHAAATQQRIAELRRQLSAADAAAFDQLLDTARRYLAFREDGKDVLMHGYGLLSDIAREAGRRLAIGDDVFFLSREELLTALPTAAVERHLLEDRRRQHRAAAALRLPAIIDRPAIDHLGEGSPPAPDAAGWTGFGVSNGQAAGPARIILSPDAPEARNPGEGFILVCPSTDPSWTPLFARAAGLVLECGGALSHGAVVARELGLPAVVVPDATRLFANGQLLRVDGKHGWVGTAAENSPPAPASHDALLAPPPPGRQERRSWKLRNIFAIAWGLYLLAFFLPATRSVYFATMHALDAVLWPLVRTAGRLGAVIILAAAVAALTLLVQRFLTDNARLLVAKRRAAVLRKAAATLPRNSPRRRMFEAQAAGAQGRILMAAMVPVGLLLGPMVLPFSWMKARIGEGPAPQAGAAVQVVARVDGEYTGPLHLDTAPELTVDPSTPAERSMPPLRQTLESLLALYQNPSAAGDRAWELNVADVTPPAAAPDLDRYLDNPIPAQAVTWVVRTPADAPGRYSVHVGDAAAQIVTGAQFPPPLAEASPAIAAGPIHSLAVIYPRPNVEQSFWRPFHFLGGKLGAWDAGWIGVYVGVYVIVLLVLRWILQVA